MPLDISISDHIATIVLNRPEAMNAIDYPMRREVQQMWGRIADDTDIHAAIITGAGDRAFCVGSDLKNTPPVAESTAARSTIDSANDSLMIGLDTDKPLICAFNGAAYGGGLEIGLACDIRIASDNARFALSEARVGTIPGSGGTQRLPRLIGDTNAMFMLLTGEPIDASEALRIGLVSRVVSLAELVPAALAIAQRITANAPLAIRAIKRLAIEGRDLPLADALELERRAWHALRDTEDRGEGRAAFAAKRPPRYTGR